MAVFQDGDDPRSLPQTGGNPSPSKAINFVCRARISGFKWIKGRGRIIPMKGLEKIPLSPQQKELPFFIRRKTLQKAGYTRDDVGKMNTIEVTVTVIQVANISENVMGIEVCELWPKEAARPRPKVHLSNSEPTL
jgi:hypothetical protein